MKCISKKCIIFIHGAGENSNLWKFQFRGLKKDFRIISIDLPGHALSKTNKKLSMNLYLEIINKLIFELKLKWIILAGHSMGGAICMSYFLKYNDLKGLILIGTGAKLKVNQVIFDMLEKNFESALEHLDSIALYSKSKEIKRFIKNESLKTSAKTYINDFKICNEYDIMNKMDKLEILTLVICGEKDLLTPIKYSNYLNEKIKNSKYFKIPKAGHDVHIEQPEMVNQLIINFINSI